MADRYLPVFFFFASSFVLSSAILKSNPTRPLGRAVSEFVGPIPHMGNSADPFSWMSLNDLSLFSQKDDYNKKVVKWSVENNRGFTFRGDRGESSAGAETVFRCATIPLSFPDLYRGWGGGEGMMQQLCNWYHSGFQTLENISYLGGRVDGGHPDLCNLISAIRNTPHPFAYLP